MLDMNIFFTIFVMLCKHTNLQANPSGQTSLLNSKCVTFCTDVTHSTK